MYNKIVFLILTFFSGLLVCMGTHTIERGDTFYGLSQRHGTDVAALNPGIDPKSLQLGQVVRVSDGAANKTPRPAAVQAARPLDREGGGGALRRRENAVDMLRYYEGSRGQPYDDGKGNMTIGIGHKITDSSPRVFGGLFGDEVGSSYLSGKTPMPPEHQERLLVEYDKPQHRNVARRLFTRYDTYPDTVRHSLLNTVFRGEVKSEHRWPRLFNEGRYEEAAQEYLNNDEYRASRDEGINPGVAKRMEGNQKAFLQYAKEFREKAEKLKSEASGSESDD